MKRTLAGLGIGVGLATLVTTSVDAQLTPGTWTGTMSPPGSQSLSVSYEVGETDGALSIVITGMGQSFSFNDISLKGDELTFWWDPEDMRIDCALVRKEEGSFEGICTDAVGEGTLTMVPPSEEDRS